MLKQKYIVLFCLIISILSCSGESHSDKDMVPSKEGASPKWLGKNSVIELNIPVDKFFELMALTEDLAYEKWPHAYLTIRPCFSQYVSGGFIENSGKECVLFYYEWGSPTKKFMSVKYINSSFNQEKKAWILRLHLIFAPENGEHIEKFKEINTLEIS